MIEFIAQITLEFVGLLGIQGVGRSLLWVLHAGRCPWPEFSEDAAAVVGILFWAAAIGGLVVTVKVFG